MWWWKEKHWWPNSLTCVDRSKSSFGTLTSRRHLSCLFHLPPPDGASWPCLRCKRGTLVVTSRINWQWHPGSIRVATELVVQPGPNQYAISSERLVRFLRATALLEHITEAASPLGVGWWVPTVGWPTVRLDHVILSSSPQGRPGPISRGSLSLHSGQVTYHNNKVFL